MPDWVNLDRFEAGVWTGLAASTTEVADGAELWLVAEAVGGHVRMKYWFGAHRAVARRTHGRRAR